MELYASSIFISAAALDSENPLPRFCAPVQNRALTHNGTFNTDEERLFGFQTGKKVLPYVLQDRYTRKREPRLVKTIVLENENLRATFLPEYGARLYSLFNKRKNREILFKNEILQFGNLGQCDAWFSGGIEFNFGHYGHTHLSSLPMFAARVNGDGYVFLRFFEYERLTGAIYRLDFHLPDGAEQLDMFVRLETMEKDTPTYWWTNTAVPQTPGCRVFSGTDKVLYALPKNQNTPDSVPCFGAGKMPVLFKSDDSYPARIDFSCEYFFQNSEDAQPWEAVAYEDGRMFFEVSTQPLRYRKMFCWGNHIGGRNWHRFLNGEAEYIEVQAGIAPTQLHGAWLKSGKPIEFTQSFGECDTPEGWTLGWNEAASAAVHRIREQVSHESLITRHERYRGYTKLPQGELYHLGSGWGALEVLRLAKKEYILPDGINFPVSSISDAQLPWLTLLEKGALPEHMPGSNAQWIIGDGWKELLEESLEQNGKHWETFLHLGVMYMENLELEKARNVWEESVRLSPSACGFRNLSQICLREGDVTQSIDFMERALSLSDATDTAYQEEYLFLLVKDGQYQRGWDYFCNLEAPSDQIRMIICEAAIELDQDTFIEKFFNDDYPAVQEGVDALTDLWFKWQAKRSGENEKDIRRKLIPPDKIDFRMFTQL